jgi:hypothetical protein
MPGMTARCQKMEYRKPVPQDIITRFGQIQRWKYFVLAGWSDNSASGWSINDVSILNVEIPWFLGESSFLLSLNTYSEKFDEVSSENRKIFIWQCTLLSRTVNLRTPNLVPQFLVQKVFFKYFLRQNPTIYWIHQDSDFSNSIIILFRSSLNFRIWWPLNFFWISSFQSPFCLLDERGLSDERFSTLWRNCVDILGFCMIRYEQTWFTEKLSTLYVQDWEIANWAGCFNNGKIFSLNTNFRSKSKWNNWFRTFRWI